jgi:hypothetical protein
LLAESDLCLDSSCWSRYISGGDDTHPEPNSVDHVPVFEV